MQIQKAVWDTHSEEGRGLRKCWPDYTFGGDREVRDTHSESRERYTYRRKHDRTSVTHTKWNEILSVGCVWNEVIVPVEKIKHQRERDLHGRFIFHQDQLIVKSWQVRWPSDAEVEQKHIGYIVLELLRLIIALCPVLFTSVARQSLAVCYCHLQILMTNALVWGVLTHWAEVWLSDVEVEDLQIPYHCLDVITVFPRDIWIITQDHQPLSPLLLQDSDRHVSVYPSGPH
jgi:hypothetical protein